MTPGDRPATIVYDTSAVLAFVYNREGADVVAENLRKGPGAITPSTLADVLAGVPIEQMDSVRATLADVFDVVVVTEEDAYKGAYLYGNPSLGWPRYTLSAQINGAVARRLNAGFMIFGTTEEMNAPPPEEELPGATCPHGLALRIAREGRYHQCDAIDAGSDR